MSVYHRQFWRRKNNSDISIFAEMYFSPELVYKGEIDLEPAHTILGDGIPVKGEANKILSPSPDKHCVGMLTTNLAYLEWVSVSCNRSLVSVLYCQIRNSNKATLAYENYTMKSTVCEKYHIQKVGCFQFQWTSYKIHQQFVHVKLYVDLQKFQHLFEAISTPLNIFTPNLSHIVTVRRYVKMHQYQHQPSINNTQGFIIRPTAFLVVKWGANIFKCLSNVHISIFAVCNGIQDCPGADDSDEVGCNCTEQDHSNGKCKYVTQSSGKCSFFYQKIYGACLIHGLPVQLYSTTTQMNKRNCVFKCITGLTINSDLMNDLVPDCGPQAEDEVNLKEVLTSGVEFSCIGPGQMPCRQGHTKCYHISDVCSFELDKFGNIHPCRTGEHMECCRNFECSTKFKCPKSYCIPHAYLCDGKWDCLYGDDELPRTGCIDSWFLVCQKMFKCSNSERCLHIVDVCDGTEDCPLGDDELFCGLVSVICPMSCHCLTYAVKCMNFSDLYVPNLLPYFVIQLKHPTFFHVLAEGQLHPDKIWKVAKIIQNVYRFILTGNEMRSICGLLGYAVLVVDLDLSINRISKISARCFDNQLKMQTLNLNRNNISQISKGAFRHQKALKSIDLSENNLNSFPMLILQDNVEILFLNIAQNTLSDIKSVAFHLIHIKILLSMKYHICCIAEQVQICIASKPWFVSCHNLIPTSALGFCICFTAGTILALNGILFLVIQVSYNSKVQRVGTFAIAMTSLCVADLLCGLHLAVLSVTNTYHGENFILVELAWRKSVTCTTIFAVALWYSILSPALLTFLSVSRTITILIPLNVKIKSVTFNISCIVICYIVTFAVVSLIILWKMYWSIVLTFNLCSPFLDPLNEIQMVKVTILLTVVVQFVALVVITIANSFLIRFIFRSSKDVKKYSQQGPSRKGIYLQILLLTGTNVLCWLLVNTIFLLSMLSEQFSLRLLVWVIVALVPINSIANPTLFLVKIFPVLVSKIGVKCFIGHKMKR